MPGIKIRDGDFGLEIRRGLHENGRRPCMNPEGIDDDKIFHEVLRIHIFGLTFPTIKQVKYINIHLFCRSFKSGAKKKIKNN